MCRDLRRSSGAGRQESATTDQFFEDSVDSIAHGRQPRLAFVEELLNSSLLPYRRRYLREREHDHFRLIRLVLGGTNDIVSSRLRLHRHVGNNEIKLTTAEGFYGRRGRRDRLHLEVLAFQKSRETLEERGVVIGHEYPPFHATPHTKVALLYLKCVLLRGKIAQNQEKGRFFSAAAGSGIPAGSSGGETAVS